LAIFAPMRPSPINPSCISLFLSVYQCFGFCYVVLPLPWVLRMSAT